MSKELRTNSVKFSFEDLEVWQKAMDFADKVINVVDKLNTNRRHYRLIEQLESSATSVSMNLYIARGSLYETILY